MGNCTVEFMAKLLVTEMAEQSEHWTEQCEKGKVFNCALCCKHRHVCVHTVVLFLTCMWWRFVQLLWLCMMYILQRSIDTLHVDYGTVLVISSSDNFYCEKILSKSNDFGLVYTILLECIKSSFTLYVWWHRQLRNVFECLY